MDNTLFESEYIFGIHEPGGEQHMLEAGKPGWVLFTEGIGHNPNDHQGADYSPYSSQGLGVISRLNNGYAPAGTIPHSDHYTDFAQRCANFVANSSGCHIWIIGNEMNFQIERPPSNTPQAASPPQHEPSTGQPTRQPTRQPTEKSLWSGVLKAVSGGMGPAELGDNAKPSGSTSDNEDTLDPFGRDDPERFSALYKDKDFRKNKQYSQRSQDSPRPGHSVGGEVITPGLYVSCYRACRDAIHNVPGHEHDQVLIGAVAPWNTNTVYLENKLGDWVIYFRHILELLGPEGCDGITLHTYTHGVDPNLIYDSAKMNKPFDHYHYHFKTYQDFMHAIPEDMRHLPVYITETDEDDPWRDANSGWVRNAYGEINHWNQQPNQQQIRALILYRWPKHDKWAITDKRGVIDDFREALVNDYRWQLSGGVTKTITSLGPAGPSGPAHPLPPAEAFTTGMVISVNTLVNLRQTAGYLNKPNHDDLLQLPAQTRVHISDDHPVEMDQLVWWQVQTLDERGALMRGWLAQFDAEGTPLLQAEPDAIQGLYQPIYDQPIQVGRRVQTLTGVYVRLTPGHQDKAENDMITIVPKGYDLTVVGGPESAHGLTWWLVYDSNNPRHFLGWVTDSWPDGPGNLQLLVQPVESLDQGNISFSQLPKPETIYTATTLGTAYLYDLSVTNEKEKDGQQELETQNVLVALPTHTAMTLLAGPITHLGQRWWKAETQLGQHAMQGWLAEKEIEFHMTQPDLVHFAPEQFAIQDSISGTIAHSPTTPVQPFQVGDLIYTMEAIRLYPAVGSTVTLEEGTISYLWPGAQAQLVDGPTMLYEQRWWQLETRFQNGDVQQGWTQELIPAGKPLFVKFGSSQPEQQYRPFSQPTTKMPADKFTTGDIAASQPPKLDITLWRSGLQVLSKEPTPLYRTAVASESRFSDEIPPKVMGILAPDIPARVLMKPRKIGGRYWACIKGQNKKEEMIHGWTPLVAKNGRLLFKLASDASEKPEEKRIEMDQPTVKPGEKPITSAAGVLQIGAAIATTDHVRMRHTPGYLNQPQDNFITELPSQHPATIIGGPEEADGLHWWQVETQSFSGNALKGWVAERAPNGQLLLEAEKSDLNPSVTADKQKRHKQDDSTEERLSVDAQHHTKYPPNQLLTSTVWLYVRLTPGNQYKTSNDVIGTLRPYTTVNIVEGPLMADDLHWYRVGGITDEGYDVVGWVAAHGTDGTVYLTTATKLPGRDIPNPRLGGRGYLTKPFIGRFGISQLWGENANIYAKYSYDGVSLSGHNGIDFLTYVGTPILAVDSGTVLRSEFGFGGFGNFVLLGHRWGQSVYAHLDERYVAAGRTVSAGTRLGVSGNTGNSTGPHLHFAIRINPYWRADGWGGYSDPLPYLYPGDVILPRYVLPFTRGLADPDANIRVTEHLPPSTMSIEEPDNGRP